MRKDEKVKELNDDEENFDYCDKCSECGGDYYRDEDGELICRCLECPYGPCQD